MGRQAQAEPTGNAGFRLLMTVPSGWAAPTTMACLQPLLLAITYAMGHRLALPPSPATWCAMWMGGSKGDLNTAGGT